jgi:hypothetical protein
MARFCVGLIILSLCGVSAAGFAQENQALQIDQSADGLPKAHVKKSAHKNKSPALQSAKPNSEEAEKAAHLAAGRKKFFDSSMGFDNGPGSSSPITLEGGNGGLSPQMGVKF